MSNVPREVGTNVSPREAIMRPGEVFLTNIFFKLERIIEPPPSQENQMNRFAIDPKIKEQFLKMAIQPYLDRQPTDLPQEERERRALDEAMVDVFPIEASTTIRALRKTGKYEHVRGTFDAFTKDGQPVKNAIAIYALTVRDQSEIL